VEGLHERKELPLLELEMVEESSLEVGERLHEYGAIGPFCGTRELVECLLEQDVLSH
jgi:hypothetical protein